MVTFNVTYKCYPACSEHPKSGYNVLTNHAFRSQIYIIVPFNCIIVTYVIII